MNKGYIIIVHGGFQMRLDSQSINAIDLMNPENLSLFNLPADVVIQTVQEAKQYVIDRIGPFSNTDFKVKINNRGGGFIDDHIAISPMIIDSLNERDSLFSLAAHEITHALTDSWGEFPSAFLSEGIAYWIGGEYEKKKYGINAFEFTKLLYVKEPTLPKPSDLLRDDKFLFLKENILATSKIAASFSGYLIERFGLDYYRKLFDEKKSQQVRSLVDKEKRLKAISQMYNDLAISAGFANFQDMEDDFLSFINSSTPDTSPEIQERIDRYSNSLGYPFWHCFWCWRPNPLDSNQCNHCSREKVV
jgi:hypothetical protein